MPREEHDLATVLVDPAEFRRTSSSSALSSPSVGPFEPRAAGSRFIIPSTSLTIRTAASRDVAPVQEPPTTESDVGPPSPVVGLAAGGVTDPSVVGVRRRWWEVIISGKLYSTRTIGEIVVRTTVPFRKILFWDPRVLPVVSVLGVVRGRRIEGNRGP